MDIVKQDATETSEIKTPETDAADLGRHLKPDRKSTRLNSSLCLVSSEIEENT